MIRLALLALCVCSVLCTMAGCAAPGPPTTRHSIAPTPVSDLSVHQYGDGIQLSFALPARTTDRQPLEEKPTIDIYRADLEPGAAPDRRTAWHLVDTIPSEQVDSYLRDGKFEFLDALPSEEFGRPSGSAIGYMVRTRVGSGKQSRDSNTVAQPIHTPPETPQDVHVAVARSALVVSWQERPMPVGAMSRVYRVYRAERSAHAESATAADGAAPEPQVIETRAAELEGTSATDEFRDANFELGHTYVYTVRTVAQFDGVPVESADSAPVTITPQDIIPPAEPTGLEAVIIPATGQGGPNVELSWAISPEADLAGYNVYRSDHEDTPGERINPQILLSPTFRDMSVQSGMKYYYRVSAVDRVGNESPRSSAVEMKVP